MRTERKTGGIVKGWPKKRSKKSWGVRLPKPTFFLMLRFQGYIRGCFRESGMEFKLWNNATFARKTGFSLSNIQKTFPRFRQWTSEFNFEKIRIGRRWVYKITRADGVVSGASGAEVRARLLGAIRRTVALAGCAKVDEVFCRKFCDISKLPPESVRAVWLNLRKIDGLRGRWRGVGKSRKFCVFSKVSESKILEGISSPTERREEKTGGASARHFPEDRPAVPSSAPGEGGGRGLVGTSRVSNPVDPLLKSPEASRYAPPVRQFRPFPPALQVCGRWVSGWKLHGVARWIAFAKLRPRHLEFDRVEFIPAHAINFANFALRQGFSEGVICAAYLAGLRTSHENSCDKDRLPGGGYAMRRKPSETVALGWQVLKRAGGSAEERWTAFFAAPRRNRDQPKPAAVPTPEKNNPVGVARFTPTEAAEKLRELRRVVAPKQSPDPAGDLSKITAGDLAKFLAGRGLTLTNFGRLGYAQKTALVRALLAEKN